LMANLTVTAAPFYLLMRASEAAWALFSRPLRLYKIKSDSLGALYLEPIAFLRRT
jgi:hypothetical protein